MNNLTLPAPAPTALRKHVKHLQSILEGKYDRNTVDRVGLRIDMVCNDHGYWGDITLEFSKLDANKDVDAHLMTYEANLGMGKVQLGTLTVHQGDDSLIQSLRAALTELGYPHELSEDGQDEPELY